MVAVPEAPLERAAGIMAEAAVFGHGHIAIGDRKAEADLLASQGLLVIDGDLAHLTPAGLYAAKTPRVATISLRLPDGTATPDVPMSLMREALDEMKAKDRKRRKAPPVKETPEDKAVSDNAYGITADELRQFIERFEQLDAEKKDIADQQKELMAEAKGRGYCTKTMRKIVVLRKKKPDDIAEEEAILDLYKTALGMG